jgi:hypothetical protein
LANLESLSHSSESTNFLNRFNVAFIVSIRSSCLIKLTPQISGLSPAFAGLATLRIRLWRPRRELEKLLRQTISIRASLVPNNRH